MKPAVSTWCIDLKQQLGSIQHTQNATQYWHAISIPSNSLSKHASSSTHLKKTELFALTVGSLVRWCTTSMPSTRWPMTKLVASRSGAG